MRFPNLLPVVLFAALFSNCGDGTPTRQSNPRSRTIRPPQRAIAGDVVPVPSAKPARPFRPSRSPNAVPNLWPKDLRVNTLVSNHGVGTAGEPGIAAVADGTGGAFVLWEDSGVGVIRTQRLDMTGNALWSTGVVSTSPAYQASPSAVSDGSGGVLVAWIDGRNGGCDSISQLNCALSAQHLDGSGAKLWGDDGVAISSRAAYPAANRFAMIADNTGGAYLAWSSGQDTYRCCSIYMQHVTGDGRTLWVSNGIRIGELPTVITGPGVTGPRLIPDGEGGAIVVWWNQQFADGTWVMTAQRIDAVGHAAWGDDVTLPFPAPGHSNFDAISDGAGGVILGVQLNDVPGSHATHLYLQRISAGGQPLWGGQGALASSQVGEQTSPALVADQQGGAFVAWSLYDQNAESNNRVGIAHLSRTGNALWPTEVIVTATSAGQLAPRLASDGNGGVIVGWDDCRSAGASDCASTYDLYTQHLDREGRRVWNEEGFPVATAKNNQGVDYGAEKRPGFEMIPDGAGGILFLWPDGRDRPCSAASAASCDLYMQRVSP